MNKQTLKKLAKLRGRSAAELRVRGAQALAAWTERHGWSAQAAVPTDAALLRQLDRAQLDLNNVSADALPASFHASLSDPSHGDELLARVGGLPGVEHAVVHPAFATELASFVAGPSVLFRSCALPGPPTGSP